MHDPEVKYLNIFARHKTFSDLSIAIAAGYQNYMTQVKYLNIWAKQ